MTTVNSEIVDGIWAIVLIQGGITLTTALEAIVAGFSLGSIFSAGPVVVMTLGGAALALFSARGLRLRRRWARRVSLLGEALLLASGVLGFALTLITRGEPVGLVTFATTLVAPCVVVVLLVQSSQIFVPKGA